MKTIQEMAREAGAEEVAADNGDYFEGCTAFSDDELEAFAALVREDEREACERDIEELLPDASRGECAAAIRARSNT